MRISVFATIASAIAMCIATACSGTGTASGDAAASAFHSVDPGGWRYSDTIALPLSAMTDSVPCRGEIGRASCRERV